MGNRATSSTPSRAELHDGSSGPKSNNSPSTSGSSSRRPEVAWLQSGCSYCWGSSRSARSRVLGSIVVTWVAFVSSFLRTFLEAPSIEYLYGRELLTAALSAITAAAVGVIVKPGIWFAVNVLFGSVYRFEGYGIQFFRPVLDTIDVPALGITVVAGVVLFDLEQGILQRSVSACSSVSRMNCSFYRTSVSSVWSRTGVVCVASQLSVARQSA